MTDENLPRFGLPELNFLTVDATANEKRIIGTYERITGRVLANGDPVRLFLLSLAAENTQLRQDFNLAARQNLLSYAQGEYLDALGNMVDTPRVQAQKAVVVLRYTLSHYLDDTYVIPAGTKASDGAHIFETLNTVEIGPGILFIDVIAEATEVGAEYNDIEIGEINTMVDPMPDMDSVENIQKSSGGADTEEDDVYAERIRLAPTSFSVAGPHDSYEYFAKSFSSAIIDVSIYGLNEHPGNVYVRPLLTGGTIPTDAFLSELYEFLSDENIRPLTDCVLVSAPEAVNYEINIKWYLDSSNINRITQITSAVAKAVEEYRLWQQSSIGRDINPDVLIKMMRDAGAKRVEIQSPIFTQIDKSQVAQCSVSDVSINYGGSEDD